MARYLLFVHVIMSILTALVAAGEYTNYTTLDSEGKYKLWWRFENATETFHFKVEVEATGWIGFGFSLLDRESWMREAMEKYDVLVAGVFTNNTIYSEDYLTESLNTTQAPDHVDKINNWKITSGEEKEGKTILEFSRKKVTDDEMTGELPLKGDIALTPGLRYFVWAYHVSFDAKYLDNISYKHTKSGKKPVMLIEEKEREPIIITHQPEADYKVRGESTIPLVSALAFIFGMMLSIWL